MFRLTFNCAVALSLAMGAGSPSYAAEQSASVVYAQPLSPSRIILTWEPFGVTPTKYRIIRDGSLIATVQSEAGLSYPDRSLTANTSYTYTLQAINADNSTTTGGRVTARTLPAGPLVYQTTFEDATAASAASIGGWFKASKNPLAIMVATERARAGRKSVKFDFRRDDWKGTSSFTNRTQLSQLTKDNVTPATIGQDFWVGISVYLEDWAPDIADNGELIWQFHGISGAKTGLGGCGSPPVALYTNGETLSVKLHADPANIYPYNGRISPIAKLLSSESVADNTGRWVDYVIKVNFHLTSGSVVIWKNGTKIVDYSGSTIYRCIVTTSSDGPYFTFGTYKWDWGNLPTRVSRRIMYVDEVRIGNSAATCADVKPSGSAFCN